MKKLLEKTDLLATVTKDSYPEHYYYLGMSPLGYNESMFESKYLDDYINPNGLILRINLGNRNVVYYEMSNDLSLISPTEPYDLYYANLSASYMQEKIIFDSLVTNDAETISKVKTLKKTLNDQLYMLQGFRECDSNIQENTDCELGVYYANYISPDEFLD